jgi:transposase-like protein
VAVLIARNVMEQRYEAVMAVVRDGEPVTEVAVGFGLSRQSVHAWMRRDQAVYRALVRQRLIETGRRRQRKDWLRNPP